MPAKQAFLSLDGDGIAGNLEPEMGYNKNLFIMNYLSGTTVVVLQGLKINIGELNFQLGQEFMLNNAFSIQGYFGFVRYNQKNGCTNFNTSYSRLSIGLKLVFKNEKILFNNLKQ